jgi:hypothetical protein
MIRLRKTGDERTIMLWFIEVLSVLDSIYETNFSNRYSGRNPANHYIGFCPDENNWISGFECTNETGLKYADVIAEIGYDPGEYKRVYTCRWDKTPHFSYRVYEEYNFANLNGMYICEFDLEDDTVAIQVRLAVG